MLQFHIIIPARYSSARLQGKVLADIAGKPMLQHVYERSVQSGASSVVIATDDDKIAQTARQFGAQVCLTNVNHSCGTSRIAEAITILNYPKDAIIVNVQGDEPLIPPVIIQQVAENLATHKDMQAATLCTPIHTLEDIFDPNTVKVIMDKNDVAIYFSRAPIPWDRDNFPNIIKNTKHHFRHIGIYAYRAAFLQEYVTWSKSALEQIEQLEQLRILWYGGKIHVAIAKALSPVGVDTKEDLEKIRNIFIKSENQ